MSLKRPPPPRPRCPCKFPHLCRLLFKCFGNLTKVTPTFGNIAAFARATSIWFCFKSSWFLSIDREQTALHKAAAYGQRRVCEALVRARASLLSEDRKGQTPRLLALTAHDDHLALFLHRKRLLTISQ
ncbi:unnamed protein product [Dibothriocephalus latus]|uniref:Uncharacterized protein n=1 Tax=Dibothriocephalus latus TaxID=60516 RepID=A0A3P7MZC4_DIBLA|nr:unnamed protein product [Dibothriocephalus latus]